MKNQKITATRISIKKKQNKHIKLANFRTRSVTIKTLSDAYQMSCHSARFF